MEIEIFNAHFFPIIKLKMCAWHRLWVKWRKFASIFFFTWRHLNIYIFFRVFHYSRKAISCRRRQSKKKLLSFTRNPVAANSSQECLRFFVPFAHRDISFFFRELPDHLTFADCLMAFNIFAFISPIWRFQHFFFFLFSFVIYAVKGHLNVLLQFILSDFFFRMFWFYDYG